jgi:uncharacterized membrane protein HdeD (DUF308 family)
MLNLNHFSGNSELLEKFSKYAKIYGVIFIILGLVGIFYPELISLTTAIFFGWLLIFSGFLTVMHTWQLNRSDWTGWLKALLFTVTGAMIVVNPMPGVIALGILFSAYFFIDAFLNISLAFRLKPLSNWWLALLNGILSLFLGIFFFEAIDNPLKTLWLVGMLLGISLFFDGIMLLGLSSAAKKMK